MSTIKAFAFRSGEITFGKACPDGALPIIDSNGRSFPRKRIEAGARLAYDGETLLVPGVPEAENDEAALAAFERWIEWLRDPKSFALKIACERVALATAEPERSEP